MVGAALYSDVIGPISKVANIGIKYVAAFIDVASRYLIYHFIPTVRYVNKCLRDTLALVRNRHKS